MADELPVVYTDEARAAIRELGAIYGRPPAAILELALGLLRQLSYAQMAGARVVLERDEADARELVLPPTHPPPQAATG